MDVSTRRFTLLARDLWARTRIAARPRARASAKRPTLADGEGVEAGALQASINCIVFSKDRAMQLDATLRSIELFAPYVGRIAVIYQASTANYEAGYRLIDVGSSVLLIRQSDDFRSDVMNALDPGKAYTVFHTDDDVFYRTATPASLPTGFAAFSLRLGKNTTYCYTLGRSQPLPAGTATGAVIAWDWTRANDDFAYPMSLNGHVMHTRLLLRMLSRARFANPNELEEELHFRRYLAPSMMLAFAESCLVSIPVNVVSSTHRNRASEDLRWAPSTLNARFLAGERIDLETMDFSNVRGAHQEIPLVFKSVTA